MWKPFKPPLLKNGPKAVSAQSSQDNVEYEDRPTKKRRLIHVIPDSPPSTATATVVPRKPLIPVSGTSASENSSSEVEHGETYYRVLW